MMKGELSGQVALISGAGRGIGHAISRVLATRGADIIVQDIDADAVSATVAEVGRLGRHGYPLCCDVTDIAALRALARDVEGSVGQIDILVNNAGIPGGEIPFDQIDEAGYERMMGIHVKGSFFLTQTVADGMKQRGSGRIINISSNRGMVGHSLSSHYSAAKAALLGLTKAWARELAPHGILVNAVAPGVVNTYMTNRHGPGPLRAEADLNLLKRWAEPEEIAYAVAFLASPHAGFITGQVLSPNGGDPIVGV